MNPLFDISNPQPQPMPQNDFMSRLQQFGQMIQGNPQQIVQNLMSSGKMSQQQFQQYAQMANQILGRR
jgi:hypothetical protein